MLLRCELKSIFFPNSFLVAYLPTPYEVFRSQDAVHSVVIRCQLGHQLIFIPRLLLCD